MGRHSSIRRTPKDCQEPVKSHCCCLCNARAATSCWTPTTGPVWVTWASASTFRRPAHAQSWAPAPCMLVGHVRLQGGMSGQKRLTSVPCLTCPLVTLPFQAPIEPPAALLYCAAPEVLLGRRCTLSADM